MIAAKLRVDSIRPNPEQPRRLFDPAKLEELAESIKAQGLLQPITVRPNPDGKRPRYFTITLGERRWRAHKLAGLSHIEAIVSNAGDQAADEQAIIENLQRVDLSALEEARSYQRMLDTYHYSVDELAKRLGMKQPWRITERTSLLSIRTEYQDLLAKGGLTASQAFELSRLQPGNQDRLFRLIREGQCATYNQLRAAADGLLEAEQQGEMFSAPKPSAEDQQAITRLERTIERACEILAGGFDDNDVVIAQKIDPNRAATMAEELALIQKHLATLEKVLRRSAAKAIVLRSAA